MGCGASKRKSYLSLEIQALTDIKTNPSNAIKLFNEAVDYKLRHIITYKESLGKSNLMIAYTYMESLKDYEKAADYATHAIPLLDGLQIKNMIYTYALLVRAYLELNKKALAAENLEKCLKVCDEKLTDRSEEKLISMTTKAHHDRKIGKFTEALVSYSLLFNAIERMPLQTKDEVLVKKMQNKTLDDEEEPLDIGLALVELSLKSDIVDICYMMAECYFSLNDVDTGCQYLEKQFNFAKELYGDNQNFKIRLNKLVTRTEKYKSTFPAAEKKIAEVIEHLD